MKHSNLVLFFSLFVLTCSKNESVDLITQNAYNPELSVEQNLNNGVDILDILEVNDINSLYGIEYNGGFIFDVNNEDGKDLPYKFWFKVENLKLIQGSYDVQVSSKNISHFKNSTGNVEYFIALEPESAYNA